MTQVPLPASPAVRVKLDYLDTDGFQAGNRFYLTYTGSAPTPANCVTLATDIAGYWLTDVAGLVNSGWSLTEVDVLDIASLTGASGQWKGSNLGTLTGQVLTTNTAVNVEFNIARRYRGGKPRIFLPAPTGGQLADAAHWLAGYIGNVNTQIAAFFNAIHGASVGSMGVLQHVNVSYYTGFKNVANSSGRERAVPQYRDTALIDVVQGYSCKGEVGSQRRRRQATTP